MQGSAAGVVVTTNGSITSVDTLTPSYLGVDTSGILAVSGTSFTTRSVTPGDIASSASIATTGTSILIKNSANNFASLSGSNGVLKYTNGSYSFTTINYGDLNIATGSTFTGLLANNGSNLHTITSGNGYIKLTSTGIEQTVPTFAEMGITTNGSYQVIISTGANEYTTRRLKVSDLTTANSSAKNIVLTDTSGVYNLTTTTNNTVPVYNSSGITFSRLTYDNLEQPSAGEYQYADFIVATNNENNYFTKVEMGRNKILAGTLTGAQFSYIEPAFLGTIGTSNPANLLAYSGSNWESVSASTNGFLVASGSKFVVTEFTPSMIGVSTNGLVYNNNGLNTVASGLGILHATGSATYSFSKLKYESSVVSIDTSVSAVSTDSIIVKTSANNFNAIPNNSTGFLKRSSTGYAYEELDYNSIGFTSGIPYIHGSTQGQVSGTTAGTFLKYTSSGYSFDSLDIADLNNSTGTSGTHILLANNNSVIKVALSGKSGFLNVSNSTVSFEEITASSLGFNGTGFVYMNNGSVGSFTTSIDYGHMLTSSDTSSTVLNILSVGSDNKTIVKNTYATSNKVLITNGSGFKLDTIVPANINLNGLSTNISVITATSSAFNKVTPSVTNGVMVYDGSSLNFSKVAFDNLDYVSTNTSVNKLLSLDASNNFTVFDPSAGVIYSNGTTFSSIASSANGFLSGSSYRTVKTSDISINSTLTSNFNILAGDSSNFHKISRGSTGQVLKQTATGYDFDNISYTEVGFTSGSIIALNSSGTQVSISQMTNGVLVNTGANAYAFSKLDNLNKFDTSASSGVKLLAANSSSDLTVISDSATSGYSSRVLGRNSSNGNLEFKDIYSTLGVNKTTGFITMGASGLVNTSVTESPAVFNSTVSILSTISGSKVICSSTNSYPTYANVSVDLGVFWPMDSSMSNPTSVYNLPSDSTSSNPFGSMDQCKITITNGTNVVSTQYIIVPGYQHISWSSMIVIDPANPTVTIEFSGTNNNTLKLISNNSRYSFLN